MRYLVFILILFVGVNCFSSQIIVEQLMGRKGLIYIGPGVEIKEGDILKKYDVTKVPIDSPVTPPPLLNPKVDEEAMKIAGGESSVVAPGVIGRDHSVTLKYSRANLNLDLDGAGEIDTKSGEFSGSYSRNFGQFELGIGLFADLSEAGTAESIVSGFTIGGIFNFVRNEYPNKLIPFIGLGLGFTELDEEDSDTGVDLQISGRLVTVGVGLKWYPFSEIAFIEFAYTYERGDFTYEGTPAFDGDIKYSGSGLSIGYGISFD